MKEDILKRAMFAMPLSKEAQNTGIMSGFDMDDMEDDVDGNADMEDMPPMARTPQNPEILMNTLRGDMRSVDARYMELAQMVGEEAAMETPPEVLAMLMGKMGAQQSGIGALPQAQNMAPPGVQAPGGQPPPPDQMGAQQPAPAIPQGGAPMPSGMESAPPFPEGAEAPQGYAVGGLVRGAQMVGDKIGQYGSAANAALGRMFMTPQGITQPFVENLRGPGGRFTAEQVNRGGDLITPTFTQGIQQGVSRLADQYPRAAQAAGAGAAALGLSNFISGSSSGQSTNPLVNQIPTDTAEERAAGRAIRDANPPAATYDISDPNAANWMQQQRGKPPGPIPMANPTAEEIASETQRKRASFPAPETAPVAPDEDVMGSFINDKLALFNQREKAREAKPVQDLKTAVTEKSKMDRIRESQKEYAPLYEELLGGDKESAKTNALLLIAEAGLKLASTRKPTFAMALADAASGLPRGFAAVIAQERELGMKVKAASLQQAISDVDSQDKYAQAVNLKAMDGNFKILLEQYKQNGGGTVEDGGLGLRITKTKQGSFVGSGIDPNDPSVKSAVSSRFTLRDTDNPFVENRGQAPTTIETDKAERIKLGNTVRSLDNSLSTLDNLKSVYTSAYGPGAWFSDKVNNLLVPVDPTGLVRPNFDTADAASRISTGMNSVLKNIASANDSGRVAVQEQEWARDTAKGISDPTKFFADKELAAKQFGSMEAMLRNARQQALTQLGFEKNDYVMNTPNTGTKNDPFIIPADPAQQKPMFTFLGSTIGKLQDPRAVVHLRMPNGTVQQFSPTQLRALNQ